MTHDVLIVAEHSDGKMSDISYEMVGKAKGIATTLGGQAIALVLGHDIQEQAGSFASDATLYVDDPALAEFNPEAYCRVIEGVVSEKSPRLCLFGSTTSGMDLGAWLSAKSNLSCVAYVNSIEVEGDQLVATSQVYAGKMTAEVVPQGKSAIALVLTGAFPAEDGRGATSPEHVNAPAPLDGLKTQFLQTIEPESGDIDITVAEKLVSVGRGIGSQDDIEAAEELAEALGAALAASRPITDANWLPKTRQVGKSGVVVKPKLNLSLGISGAPEHLEGMKDSELIIAVNTDPNAPIFDVAHYGTTVDLFDVAEAMLEQLE
ncbi:MAG: electron transfer flavoprotein subunit alpha/FixB family protein [Anaerolineales bacterium]